jgi:dienelactone hydrolase
MKAKSLVFLIGLFLQMITLSAFGQTRDTALPSLPDTVSFVSEGIQLKGLIWKPIGSAPFPAVLFNHGSEASAEKNLDGIASAFTSRGYAFFVPFRRGQGLSRGHGRSVNDEMDSASKAGGPGARFQVMMRLHQTSQLADQKAGLNWLKAQRDIDSSQIAVAGASFGGIQAMLMAGEDVGIRAALNFAGAAMAWDRSPEVGRWMKELATRARVPVFFIQAANDFSIEPSLQGSEEMKRAGKPYQIKIYPPRGTSHMNGHTLIDETAIWAPDVFPQLDKWMK